MKASTIMRRRPAFVTPAEELSHAAELMHYERDACIPVVRDPADPVLLGVITARDIAVRCVARRHPRTCLVGDHMTPAPLHTVQVDDDIGEVIRQMEEGEVRRIPVVSADGVLLGMVTEEDLGPTLRAREAYRARVVAQRSLVARKVERRAAVAANDQPGAAPTVAARMRGSDQSLPGES